MADRSSSKKIQRVQQAGVSRTPGQRRELAFPAAVALVLILGSIGVFLARDARINKDGEAPVAGKDNWVTAIGFLTCDEYADPLSDQGKEGKALGIHSHNDGLIAVHPNSEEVSGENATLGKFFEAVGVTVTSDSFELPPATDGGESTTASAGDTCTIDGEETTDTSVKMFYWPPQSNSDTEPTIIEDNCADQRIEETGQIFSLALVPNDLDPNDVKLPPSVNRINSPAPEIQDEPVTTTVPDDAATTTVVEETSTTVPPTTEPGE